VAIYSVTIYSVAIYSVAIYSVAIYSVAIYSALMRLLFQKAFAPVMAYSHCCRMGANEGTE
jgi:hypothetical protein